VGLIFLTGMPGAGKSAVGEKLAGLMGIAFVDLDREIEVRADRRIGDLFDDPGEAVFREMEAAALREAVTRRNAVIALGAGALQKDESLSLVLSSGVLVYLRADLEMLVARNRGVTHRPLLPNGLDETRLRARLKQTLQQRKARYVRAHIIIDTDDSRTPEDIARSLAWELMR
jgi:shikimate kinase